MPLSSEAGPSNATVQSSQSPAKIRKGHLSTSRLIRERNVDFNVLGAAAFAEDYLTALPKGFRGRHRDLMALFNEERRKMSGGRLNELQQYKCIVDMLNHVSVAVYTEILDTHPAALRLQFIDTHAAHLIRHPKGYKDKPDICAVESHHVTSLEKTDAGNYHRVPWHKTRSVGEVKPSTNDSKKGRQIMSYAASHNLARPDRPGCLVVSVSPRGYQIAWSDPSGGHISETIGWDDKKGEFLLSFVYSLYIPPASCAVADSTITLVDPTTSLTPLWNINFKGKLYKECSISFVGEAHSRQTMIFRHEADGCVRIIKDQYPHKRRRFKEPDLYEKLDGTAGWVTVIESGDVGVVVGSGESAREKKRLIMSSGGDALNKVKSVKTFLMSMYDILEAHRYAVMKKQVMHRDMSHRNILMNPFGIPDTNPEGPIFVNAILNSQNKGAQPTALICDLDNGCVYRGAESSEEIKEQLKSRTGTPMFIARAVEAGQLQANINFSQMPQISDVTVAERYSNSHQGEAMRTFRDEGESCHGSRVNMSKWMGRNDENQRKAWFHHQPRHDVESVGWCIIAFFLRAQPKELEGVEDSLKELHNAWEILSGPVRLGLLTWPQQQWERALHPRLKFLGDFLLKLGAQMEPEYGFLDPPPAEDHLHEAFQRLLLNQIHDMKEDVELNIEKLRALPELKHYETRDTTTPFGASIGQVHSPPANTPKKRNKRAASNQDEDDTSMSLTICRQEFVLKILFRGHKANQESRGAVKTETRETRPGKR
ncbi:uncharacterized protein EV420DRAFT_472252 [Desarmillaria tabescens]|uniref:Fungal-type protein kinase domain-containing protein n=1 Tax=Armillaria tabescens TaxID=1929756 RepID=A0AA39KBA3_ARMTA|nr:uncharacterized protein EV420DRAFT_472252 [Desarmillaria tabescens]KAK0457673.1 hypothetical protein EV420DRAFT_472252 [Desarmillaria tabescens]